MNELRKRACKLLCVKSIVTLTLTGVFAFLAVTGTVSQEFMAIYTMIMGFYFGTQTVKGDTL